MHLVVAVAQLSGQQDDLSNDQLGHRSRVGEGRVEDGDALGGSMLEIDLVGTDTETSNDAQLLGSIQNLLGQLCLGADTNTVDILNLLDQHILSQCLCMCLDLMVVQKYTHTQMKKHNCVSLHDSLSPPSSNPFFSLFFNARG